MALEIMMIKTDEARRRTAEAWVSGKAFQVVGFSLGDAGHDPSDPTTALSPDPSISAFSSVVFGPKALTSVEYANRFCPLWTCTVDPGEGSVLFSSVCLIAQIVSSPVPNDPELNSTFVFAIANLPLRPKLSEETLDLIVGIQG